MHFAHVSEPQKSHNQYGEIDDHFVTADKIIQKCQLTRYTALCYTVYSNNRLYMVRTQLYLPESLYEALKENAKAKNMTFASYVRIYLEKEVMPKEYKKSLHKAFPFLKFAEIFHGKFSSEDLTNEAIDKAIYDL